VAALHQYLSLLLEEGAECAAIEVSSHGLVQGRLDEIAVDCAIFTNLSRDHLDYHETMAAYMEAKLLLFKRPGLKLAVINADDPCSAEFIAACSPSVQILTYGVSSGADVRATKVKVDAKGIRAQITTPWGDAALKTKLIGQFNLSNLLAVIATAGGMGLPINPILHAAGQVKPVPGRMQRLSRKGLPAVIVDYAHTPDALQNVLASLKPFCTSRLIVVFGCGGDRDTGKRPAMAKLVETYADVVVITDDNPRNEDPEKITRDILGGLSAPDRVVVIHDRKSAIHHALSQAGGTDLILVAGKGHENYQEIQGVRHHFDDVEVVEHLLDQLAPQKKSQIDGVICD
jgi:UDP-N-acetylmuramoyl-L-alanyl-D-glutamate--2,6-diaminopimelate ligase